ncbi:MAG: hypothetical protein LBT59_15810 [Clostridiales bacterium]|jgi:hypothetical protein|nr:hypothetical protein [Clostridiales bacterium]
MLYALCAIFTAISAAVSFGFSVEACIKAKAEGDVAQTNAKYALSRSLAALLCCAGFVFPSDMYLTAVAVAMICIQLFDGIIGIKISLFKTLGPSMTAAVNAILLSLYIVRG